MVERKHYNFVGYIIEPKIIKLKFKNINYKNKNIDYYYLDKNYIKFKGQLNNILKKYVIFNKDKLNLEIKKIYILMGWEFEFNINKYKKKNE